MSTPISSIEFPGNEEEYLLRDHRCVDTETGAATPNDYGFIKLPTGAVLDQSGRLSFESSIGMATSEKLGLVKVGFEKTKKRVPVMLDESGNAYVEVGTMIEGASSSGVSFPYGKQRWLTFDFNDANHRSVKIKQGVKIRLDIKGETPEEDESRWYVAEEDMIYDLSTALSQFEQINPINGANFYLYLVPDGEEDTKIVLSRNSTIPNDVDVEYTANNSRKIGQFHTLCVAIPSTQKSKMVAAHGSVATGENYLVKAYNDDDEGFYDFYNKEITSITSNALADLIVVGHPLAGFESGDILPESVWCLSFRPYSEPAGMVYDVNTDRAIDIYLQSGTGRLTASEYNVTHTVSREQQNHEDDMMQVRKRLLFDYEFTSAASGSNERTNISGSKDWGVVGGHVDTAGDRMTSFIGCEEMCGYLWQWSENVGPCASTPDSSQTYDRLAWLGQTSGRVTGLFFGGPWFLSSGCGSRSRVSNSDDLRSNVNTFNGGRGASWVLRM